MRIPFGDFVLDTGARELLREGQPLHVSPKALRLLETLVSKRPNAISKSELQETLWPDTFVVESNLANLVGELRSALGDDPRRPRYVRTVHGFGYAFRGVVGAGTAVCRLVWKGGEMALGQGEHLLGREPGLAVELAAPGVSRRHALIRVAGEDATIEDLGSKNGTYVNGQKLQSLTPLADGNQIRVGSFAMTFRSRLSRDATETLG